ncbi:Na(+)-translocating NADH-quinone reductase subunit A [Shewanella sp. 4_MG-2023]|uniref:Na(+)-translocating NADH-quinone reductase subunit A n=1 Tax=Shewanella sp. 4_MG-2023 TaxID=3062652 RepID=UPI0026E48968|nr:Na(+)-translocating NADH-quinone reductase subunit A [Shewanella sp. 4_MG-2023]MDO6678300.1 Na(+)-translocating NADH-quinone reductase subunit A [Shewanella sp. 4_MG-2023]
MAGSSNQVITIKRGLDVPIAGEPQQIIDVTAKPTRVAILGEEYVGLKPTMLVEEGDIVKKGQALFQDKKIAGVTFTAPASGEVIAINRGEKRVLLSVVIRCEGDEAVSFATSDDVLALSREAVQTNLVNSGLWTALRTRPFSKIPALDTRPSAIFVTAMDSNPLAADPRVIIAEQPQAFAVGMQALTRLTDGKVMLCHDQGEALPGHDLAQVESYQFGGVHPAGLVGTHIHLLHPVSVERVVWHIGYQDVIAVGKLFQTGELFNERVVSFAGPNVLKPRLVRTQLGADLGELVENEIEDIHSRVVSGSVLCGHTAVGVYNYLGRYHNQVCVLTENARHELLPWVRRNKEKFSLTGIMMSGFSRTKKLFDFTTHAGGSPRAMMAFGQLARVMPLDILPTLLVRDLVVRDTDEAQLLGALELDEEDLALCTFVCPGKYDFGKELRACLDIIEREG